MTYVVGIDSGGTKAESLLVDETGHILLRDVGPGCQSLDIGQEEAKRRFLSILDRMCAAAPEKVSAIYSGMAGANLSGPYLQEQAIIHTGVSRVRIQGDANCIITGKLGLTQDACSMICGTGCSLVIRIGGEKVAQIGGRGYLIDTGGSGYDLGREAFRYAYRGKEGRGQKTVLTEILEERMGESLDVGVPKLYAGGRAKIASFASAVFEGLDRGDWICHQIADQESGKLAELTWAAEQYFPGEFPVVMNGGIFRAYPHYAQMVIAKASPRAQMILSDIPPVYGSVVLAMAQAGLECDEAFKERFLRDYQEIRNRK